MISGTCSSPPPRDAGRLRAASEQCLEHLRVLNLAARREDAIADMNRFLELANDDGWCQAAQDTLKAWEVGSQATARRP